MEKILNMQDVWDNGLVSSTALSGTELDSFKERTAANCGVARRWTFQGTSYETSHRVRLLPDQYGLVYYEKDDPRSKRLVVVNGDKTHRVTIEVPRIDENSIPSEGYLSLPPSAARFGGIEWGCEGNDGHSDYLFDFDWTTGLLIRYARPTRPW